MLPKVKETVDKVLSALVPAAAWSLTLVVPIVPAAVWAALFNAMIAGDITLAHLQQFLKDHDIQTYPDYPQPRDQFGSH